MKYWTTLLLLFILGACHYKSTSAKVEMANIWDSIGAGMELNEHQVEFLGLADYCHPAPVRITGDKCYQLNQHVIVALVKVKNAVPCEQKILVTFHMQEGRIKGVRLLDEECAVDPKAPTDVHRSHFTDDTSFSIECVHYEAGDTNLLGPIVGVAGGNILQDGSIQ